MLPEVEQLVWDLAVAMDTYRKKSAQGYSDAFHREWERTTEAAWKKLGETTDDKLVKWIATHATITKEYSSYAERIVEALPATLAELDEIAENDGWCGVWDNFRRSAIAANVVDVKYDLEWRINGVRSWHTMRQALQFPKNQMLYKDTLTPIFSMGADQIQVTVNGDIYTIRRADLPN